MKSWCCPLSLYVGLKQQLMCCSWKFRAVHLTTERSATLTKTPLKLKSQQRSSQERRDLLTNKHSMTNPFSQMTRPSHLLCRMVSIYMNSKGKHHTGLIDGITFLTEAHGVNKANTAAFAQSPQKTKMCQTDHLCAVHNKCITENQSLAGRVSDRLAMISVFPVWSRMLRLYYIQHILYLMHVQ